MLRILLPAAAIALPLVTVASSDAAAGDDLGGTPHAAAIAVSATHSNTAPIDTASTDTASTDTVPVDTANPFLPEQRDLTECIGLLQRPGCGSEARGGLGQTLVAILMIGGLVLIFGRVAWGLRRNRRQLEDLSAETAPQRTGERADDGADPSGPSDAVADVATGSPADAESSDDAS